MSTACSTSTWKQKFRHGCHALPVPSVRELKTKEERAHGAVRLPIRGSWLSASPTIRTSTAARGNAAPPRYDRLVADISLFRTELFDKPAARPTQTASRRRYSSFFREIGTDTTFHSGKGMVSLDGGNHSPLLRPHGFAPRSARGQRSPRSRGRTLPPGIGERPHEYIAKAPRERRWQGSPEQTRCRSYESRSIP